MLTDEERAAARKLCDEATAGPWRITAGYQSSQEGRYDDDVSVVEAVTEGGAVPVVEHVYYDGHHTIVRPVDAAFIAATRALLPAVLDDLALMHGRVVGLGALVDLRGETIARLEVERDRAIGWRDEGMREADRLRERLATERAEILNALKLWVAERREAETAERPDVNMFKRVLLATWNQVEAKIDEVLARKQAEAVLAGMIDASKEGT